MDMQTFHAEYLLFLRTNPLMRSQLLKELSAVEVAEERPSGEHIPFKEALKQFNLYHTSLSTLIRKKSIPFFREAHSKCLFINRTVLEAYCERQNKVGYYTHLDIQRMTGIPIKTLAKNIRLGHYEDRDGWVRLQDVVDFVLRYSPRPYREKLVTSLENWRNQPAPAPRNRPAPVEEDEQLALAL